MLQSCRLQSRKIKTASSHPAASTCAIEMYQEMFRKSLRNIALISPRTCGLLFGSIATNWHSDRSIARQNDGRPCWTSSRRHMSLIARTRSLLPDAVGSSRVLGHMQTIPVISAIF